MSERDVTISVNEYKSYIQADVEANTVISIACNYIAKAEYFDTDVFMQILGTEIKQAWEARKAREYKRDMHGTSIMEFLNPIKKEQKNEAGEPNTRLNALEDIVTEGDTDGQDK